MKLLAGITHAIVEVSSKKYATESGVVATVDFCFGPGDETSISHVQYVKTPSGNLVWKVPHIFVTTDGMVRTLPVFRGELLEQLCKLAGRALDRIKTDVGRPQYSTRYRVADNKAVVDNLAEMTA